MSETVNNNDPAVPPGPPVSPAGEVPEAEGSTALKTAITRSNPDRARFGKRDWICALLLVGVTVLAYLPALHGGFVWDDDAWTTNLSGLFQNASGLHSIWFQPTVLQQYYPLTGTTFWLDYQLWKFWTLPYHVENILLHVLAALLFWRLLLRLQLPGAWLAAALFALHPVMVESVAWITERKNVLSLALYLAALLAYLRCAQGVTGDKSQGTRTDSIASRVTGHASLFYGLAFILFLGALLAKTTAFSLPAVILLLGWWKRGQIRWRADVLPTLPFFALSLGLCAVTAWLEKNHVGAQGPDFALTIPQRCLVAGRAFWFYPGHLFWPANLCFVYPRWQPAAGSVWQWLYPVTALGLLFTLWLVRGRIGRGPVTALLFYVGTLFPLLGFMNAYGMRFSFVWDHWVYLSTLGIIALVAGGVARVAELRRRPAMVYGFGAIVLPVLALLTWRQCGMYADIETLWQTTIARNPNCWMAYNNLGLVLFEKGRVDEAMVQYQKALEIKPDNPEAHNNFGGALYKKGRVDEAMVQYQKALEIKPDDMETCFNIGNALLQKGSVDEAIAYFQRGLEINPDNAEAHYNLGKALLQKGSVDEAIACFQRGLEIKSDNAEAHYNLGNALLQKGSVDEAITHFQTALGIKPDYMEAHNNLGNALLQKGSVDEAIVHYQKELEIKSDNAEAHNNLGNALLQKGSVDEAMVHFQTALEIKPDFAEACFNLGAALFLKGKVDEAVVHYQQALEIKPDYPEAHNNFGVALYQKGEVDEAIAQYQQALEIKPDFAEAHNDFGAALYQKGSVGEAIAQYQQALQIKPGFAEARNNLDHALLIKSRVDEVIAQCQKALRLNPDNADVLNNLAWLLATCPDADIRDGTQAVQYAGRACELTHNGVTILVGTLAAAYAEAGRYDDAIAAAQKACALATAAGEWDLLGKNQQLLALYLKHQPYHEAAGKFVSAAP